MTHVTLLLTEIIYCTTIYRSHVALEVKEWAETWQCLVTLGDPTARCWIAEPPFLRTEASLCSKLLKQAEDGSMFSLGMLGHSARGDA